LDLDYSPTGEEIVTGAYDRTLRLFHSRKGHSRDIYHTKRMQRIFCVKFSMDSKYVLSAVKNAQDTKRIMLQSQRRKEENLRKHSKKDFVPYKAERKK
ncbi:5080_t:CDS:2, partial [Racocetra fulgida]